jgi:hypothetical protein
MAGRQFAPGICLKDSPFRLERYATNDTRGKRVGLYLLNNKRRAAR